MKIQIIRISDLKEIEEFKNFYEKQSIEDLTESIRNYGQLVPIHVKSNYGIADGYKRVEAIKAIGGETVIAIVLEGEPDLYTRISFNQYRQKSTSDKIKELREVFRRFPKRQGQRTGGDQAYDRAEKISAATNGRWKNDVIQNNLEYILNNDLPGDLLSRSIVEMNGKVDTCYDFLTKWMNLDIENGYGFTAELIRGTYSVSETSKFIAQRHKLDEKHGHTFVIPDKCSSYHMDCVKLAELSQYNRKIDLIITSVPYWDLRTYKVGDLRQLGQEESKEEYARNVSSYLKALVPTYKESINVFVNVGETYKEGVAQGIPYLIKEAIERNTPLIYKGTLIWSKKNPRPQGEKIKRPTDNTEFVLWYVLDQNRAKYNLLTFPVEGKVAKVTLGAKDVSNSGDVSKKTKSISKNYGKIMSHLREQEIENIIVTSVGKNHDIFKISEVGHPAPMSPMLPVTLILMGSDEHDLVCDPFSGSNVVGKIAVELNRRFVSTEISKEYFEIGCEMLTNGNENFNRESLDEINALVYNSSQNDLMDDLQVAA